MPTQALAGSVRATDGTARRSTRPEPRKAAQRRELNDQLNEYMIDHSDEDRARIVARFRL